MSVFYVPHEVFPKVFAFLLDAPQPFDFPPVSLKFFLVGREVSILWVASNGLHLLRHLPLLLGVVERL